MPKVSVIVPIYGVETYIERCVRSLFAQTLTDIEYIFVDDCTPDSSIDILKKLENEYSIQLQEERKTVKLFRMHENSGQAAVRNFAIQKATGDYVIHCDSDDWIDLDMYKIMYEKAEQTMADITICDFYQSSPNKNIYIKACYHTDKKQLIYDFMNRRGYWSLWNKLVRRNLYDDICYYPSENMGEDLVITLQLLHYANQVEYVKKAFYYYCINPSSIVQSNSLEKTANKFKQVVNNVRLIEQFLWKNYSGISLLLSLDSLKYKQLNILNPLLSEKQIRKLWGETYPTIKYRIWINPCISVKEKAKFYLRLLGLYK